MKYLYQCKRCDHEWEAVHRLTERPPDCPECQAPQPKRLIAGGTSFTLKGDGWAKDQYS